MKPLSTLTRSGVREWLQGRYWLRLHMFVIVAVTFGAGLVATWTLMRLGVHVLALRYAIAVCSAYLVFLALVRLWIWFACSDGTVDLDPFDVVEVGVEVADSAPSLEVASPSDAGNLSLDIGDPEGCVGVVVLAAFAALFILAGGYLIYTAPAILAEAAFEALLAAALARRAKRVAGGGWVGSVFLSTFWVFATVLAFSVALGWYAQMRCPEALRLRDAVKCADVARAPRLR